MSGEPLLIWSLDQGWEPIGFMAPYPQIGASLAGNLACQRAVELGNESPNAASCEPEIQHLVLLIYTVDKVVQPCACKWTS